MKEEESMRERMQKWAPLSMFSVEKAAAFINAPVYGLTEEVCELRHALHGTLHQDRLRIEYASPRYMPHKKGGRNFVVESRLYEEEPLQDPKYKPELAILAQTVLGVEIITSKFPGLDRSHLFAAKDAVFTIDSKCFKGYVSYRTAPVYYSRFVLYHGRLGILGEALGPSLEEFIQIVENLHVLNGKEVESSR